MRKKWLVLPLIGVLVLCTACAPKAKGPYSQVPLEKVTTQHDAAWWWQEYIADGVYQFQSGMGKDRLEDESNLIEYAITKAAIDGRSQPESSQGMGSDTWVTKEVLEEYLARYFGLENSDGLYLTQLTNDAGEIGFYCVALLHQGEYKEEGKSGDGVFEVRQIEYPDQYHVQVQVVRVVDEYAAGYDREYLYSFAHTGEDRYILEGVQLNKVHKEGVPQTTVEGAAAQSQELSGITPLNGLNSEGVLNGTFYYMRERNGLVALTGAKAETLEPVAPPFYLTLERGEKLRGCELTQEGLAVMTSTRWFLVSPKLDGYEEKAYPQPVANAVDVCTAFSVSFDLRYFGYCDYDGAKIYDTQQEQEVLLAAHPHFVPDAEGRAMMSNLTWGTPAFTRDGKYALSTQYGYEYIGGMLVWNLSTGESRVMEAAYGWGSNIVGPVQGKLLAADNGQKLEEGHYLMDLETGEIQPLELSGIHQMNPGISSIFVVDGDRLFYLDQQLTQDGSGSYQTTLYQVDLETGAMTPTGFSATGGEVSIRGAGEGWLLLSYVNYNDMTDYGMVSVRLDS